MSRRRAVLLAAPVAAALAVAGVPSAFGQGSVTSSKGLFAVLKGSNELNARNQPGHGKRGSHGTFSAVVRNNQLCYGLTVSGLDKPTAAHIHVGGPRKSGGIVIPLTQPSSGDPGAMSACISGTAAPPRVLRQILAHPNRFYVNVHTGTFPAGAMRGQLQLR
jgi:CHRD domain-containing protein